MEFSLVFMKTFLWYAFDFARLLFKWRVKKIHTIKISSISGIISSKFIVH